MNAPRTLIIVAAVLIAGCITINVKVSFPEAQFQEAADKIVDEVQGNLGESPSDGSALPPVSFASWSFVSAAYADIDITVENPEIEAIKKKMKENFEQYKKYKDNGSVGENLSGYLKEREEGSDELSEDEQKELRKLIQRENADRKDLYLAILKANGYDSSELPTIEKIFAKSWYKKSLSHWYVRYKDPDEGEIWLTKSEWDETEEATEDR